MELHERIAFARQAAGLTREQLAQRLDASPENVAAWESGQTPLPADTAAKICQALGVSADFVLLGREPDGSAPGSDPAPAVCVCPCCGKQGPQNAPQCQQCGYDFYPSPADDSQRFAVILTGVSDNRRAQGKIAQFTQKPLEQVQKTLRDLAEFGNGHRERALLRRDLPRSAALWVAACLRDSCGVRIVADDGCSDDQALEEAPEALSCPESPQPPKQGIGFWGIVGAVLLALLIASFL